MPIADRQPAASAPADTSDHQRSFRVHVFTLVAVAYGKLDAKSHQRSDEDTITQRLTEAIDAYVEEGNAPRWAIHFWATDQRKDGSSGATGKGRPVLDLSIGRTQRGPRPRFTFEAKRLYDRSGERQYLGSEGLGAYVDGTYRREDDEAGMLGYVQRDSPSNWAARIEQEMKSKAASLAVCPGGGWQAVSIVADLPHSYLSRHDRRAVGRRITMYHVLLAFC